MSPPIIFAVFNFTLSAAVTDDIMFYKTSLSEIITADSAEAFGVFRAICAI